MKKFLSCLLDILVVIIIVFAIFITLVSINQDSNGIARFGGYVPLNIQSGSMEPKIKVGDFIIAKETDPKSLKENDVISFLSEEEGKVIIKTHRIVKINKEDGYLSFTTKGDNNQVEDNGAVVESNVIAKYSGTRIPYLGKILTFLQSKIGFFAFIILPLFCLFIYQLYKFVVTIMDEKKKDLIESIRKEEQEKLKEEK